MNYTLKSSSLEIYIPKILLSVLAFMKYIQIYYIILVGDFLFLEYFEINELNLGTWNYL